MDPAGTGLYFPFTDRNPGVMVEGYYVMAEIMKGLKTAIDIFLFYKKRVSPPLKMIFLLFTSSHSFVAVGL